MRRAVIVLALALAAPAVWAEAPAGSLRPRANPQAAAVSPVVPSALAPAATPTSDLPLPGTPAVPHPKARPASLGVTESLAEPAVPEPAVPDESAPEEAATEAALPPDPGAAATQISLRPRPRPENLAERIELASAPVAETEAPAKGKKREKQTKKGSVCGDPAIKGEKLSPIRGKVKGCGLDAPVRVTAIDGIRLNQPATISCDTAIAFKDWINGGLRPAMGKREVVEIRIAASYICRPRNNKKGAKISEHGRGKAIDVAGFVFADGKQWSIAGDYNKEIRKAHKAACGIFGTTLGPGSDGYHEDHLHFDIARYNSGSYCR